MDPTQKLTAEDVANIVYEVVNAKAASLENKGKRAPETPKQKKNRPTSSGTVDS